MLDRSKLEIRRGKYATAPASALEDGALLSRVQAYRRQSGARMTACDRPRAERKMPSSDFHVSRKVDGEFCALVVSGGEAVTVNPGGTVRVGFPALDEVMELAKKAGVENLVAAAEFYVGRPDGGRPRVHDVNRVARKPVDDAEVESLRLAVFDLIELGGEPPPASFLSVWERIQEVFGSGVSVHPVESEVAHGARGALKLFDRWVGEEGAEGVVARSDVSGIFKIKPRHTLDVVVIGFAEGVDDRAGMIHDLLLGILRADGSMQVLGRVGGGFSDDERRDFLSDLSDMVVDSDYTEVNSDRVAYTMVRPEWVVEISCLDLVSQTTRGASIDRMVIHWNDGDGRWENQRRLPLVSILSPQFIRRREDKTPTPEDVSFSQLTDIVEIEGAESSAEDLSLPKSELLARVVATKSLKGNTMVRKLVMWKTNKDELSEDFPPYVLHFTDFSPNRKDPLKREIRVSSSKDQIRGFFDELKEKNFVRGWTEVTAVGGD